MTPALLRGATRALLLGASVVVFAACSDVAVDPGADLSEVIASAEPGAVLELAQGRHQGPITIDKPITIIGGPGAVLEAPDDSPVVTIEDATSVTLRDVYIRGGEPGILVRRSEDVRVEGVTVEQALWHGILVQDSEVHITDCLVSGLRAPTPQGIEIINSDARPASTVRGCTIEGPVFEGIAAHVSHVTFADNEVIGATERGIVVTEMSDGRMEGNQVTNSRGAAYFCGDMSNCSVVDNRAEGISAGRGHASARGHGVVVHYHSHAFVDGVDGLEVPGERVLLMIGSTLLEEEPIIPR
jgi:nitrous oxidase accessory protein